MKLLRIFILLSLASVATGVKARASVTITLRENVNLKGDFIRLNDLAKLSGETDLRSRLQRIFFGPTPQIGLTKEITRLQIRTRIKEFGLAGNVIITGANSVIITRANGRAGRLNDGDGTEELLANQKAKIAAAKARCNGRIAKAVKIFAASQIRGKNVTIGVRVRSCEGSLENNPQQLKVGSILSGQIPGRARVNIVAAGKQIATGFLTAEVEISVNAPVILLRKGVRRGGKLSAENLISSRREVTPGVTWLNGKAADYVGRVTSRSIAGGIPLRPQDLALPLAVHKGQQVKVINQLGSIRIQMYGIATHAAREGEMVRLVNPRNPRQVFIARVTGPGKAQINNAQGGY